MRAAPLGRSFLGLAGGVLVLCILTANPLWAQTYSFSTCGQTGREGPSQGMCDTEYSSTTLDGSVTVSGGIQAWTVPETAVYRVEAYGGEGGTQLYGDDYPGGRGAYAACNYELTAGETIYVLVGQRGEDTRADDQNNAAPGGGGGSFVYRDANDPYPLVAAGGGGSGSRQHATPTSDQDGNDGTAGNDSGSLANGGSGGNGGLNNVGGDSYWAGGGAGWLTDGTGGEQSTDYNYMRGGSGGDGGRAPRNGGVGGLRYDDGNDEGGDGGFGGGGGGGSDNMGGGGGGGFSGGGGARGNEDAGNQPGGGGGSYCAGGVPQIDAGDNPNDGAVVISYLAPGVEEWPVPSLTPWATLMLLLLLGAAGLVAMRRSVGAARA